MRLCNQEVKTMLPEMHKAKYNPKKMKCQIQFRRAAKLAKINRGRYTVKQAQKANADAYNIAKNWG